MNRAISWSAAALVFLVSVIAFILSYNALQDVAATNGVPGRLAYLWPLLIDFPLVVFSLAILRANLYKESARWPWVLVITFTVATITFNLIHAADSMIARSVAAVAPIALFLSFETLVGMIRNEINRAGMLDSLQSLTGQIAGMQDQLTTLRQQVKTTVSRRDNLQAEIESLTGEANGLLREREHLTAEIETLAQDLTLERETVAVRVSDTRQRIAEILTENDKLSSAEVAGRVGVSAGRVRQIRKELTGIVNGQN